MNTREKVNLPQKEKENSILNHPINRKRFLMFSGITALGIGLGIQGCSEDDIVTTSTNSVDLGAGDVGVLNYAYALEQLEAAFYIQVAASFYSGATSAEIQILTDIRDHEIAHRDFFKAAIGSAAIPSLEVNFSSIDFTSRNSVLNTAKAFEDLGVSAYNGAGYLIDSAAYLELAGKIVSVEARHAATIRDLLNPRSPDFAGNDVVDAAGLDVKRLPSEVLNIAKTYLVTSVTANNLP
ncbi:MAG TPA: ferritin-like domain-containing protein [Ignavibacteria bacterium]|nr:ferritin-like domain-containing protein [Ignavibacteria bacterium]